MKSTLQRFTALTYCLLLFCCFCCWTEYNKKSKKNKYQTVGRACLNCAKHPWQRLMMFSAKLSVRRMGVTSLGINAFFFSLFLFFFFFVSSKLLYTALPSACQSSCWQRWEGNRMLNAPDTRDIHSLFVPLGKRRGTIDIVRLYST